MIAGNAELLTQQHLLIGITGVRDRGLRRRQHGPDGEAAPQSPENLKAVEGWKGHTFARRWVIPYLRLDCSINQVSFWEFRNVVDREARVARPIHSKGEVGPEPAWRTPQRDRQRLRAGLNNYVPEIIRRVAEVITLPSL